MLDKYFTRVSVKKSRSQLNYSDSLFFMGSCFANNLYSRFNNYRLDVLPSPFGNIYNPLSLAKLLTRLLERRDVEENELIYSNGLYQHLDFHSTAGRTTPKEYLDNINPILQKAADFITKADWIVITLGTAFIYEKDEVVVNNCHKLPKNEFNRRAIDIDETIETLGSVFEQLKKRNPSIRTVLTLSPVRHLRDDATENSLSKALLRVIIDKLTTSPQTYYFPSYEILLDELRDYRWYDSSLTHPTEQAVDYIMEKFYLSYGSEEFNLFRKDAEKVLNMLNHKILKPDSDEAIKFLDRRERALRLFKNSYPEIRSY